MNVFYEPLPETVRILGTEYSIITDFREWIRFSDMLKSDIPVGLKREYILEMFLDQVPEIGSGNDMDNILEAFSSFLAMESTKPETQVAASGKKSKANISYEYDASSIISAFLRDYRIDLLEIPYLHWWKFKMLFEGLDEKNQIKEILYYRDVDVSRISDKEERKRVQRIKKEVMLPEEQYVTDGDIGNAFI